MVGPRPFFVVAGVALVIGVVSGALAGVLSGTADNPWDGLGYFVLITVFVAIPAFALALATGIAGVVLLLLQRRGRS